MPSRSYTYIDPITTEEAALIRLLTLQERKRALLDAAIEKSTILSMRAMEEDDRKALESGDIERSTVGRKGKRP